MWWLLSALLLADPELVIRATDGCPGAEQIAAEIAPLLPSGITVTVGQAARGPGADRATLVVQDGRRSIRLEDADGRLVQERPLASLLTCSEAARAAAVLIAAWEFQGHADLPAPPPSSRPAPAASPPPPAADPPPSPRPRSLPAPRPLQASVPAPAPGRRMLAVGAGASLGVAGDSRPVGALAELLVGLSDSVGLRFPLSFSSQYAVPIGPGQATWWRIAGGVGGTLGGRRGSLGGLLHLDLLASRLAISGKGLPTNESGSQLLLGLGLGARASVTVGSAAFWLDLAGTAWPGRHTVVISDSPDSSNLPSVEMAATLGVSFFVRS